MPKLSEQAQENKTRYNIEYAKKNYSRIPLDVPKEYHIYLKERAKADGQTLNAWIKQAIEERAENTKEEIPQKYIDNIREWLLKHGHTERDFLDCIKYITGQR